MVEELVPARLITNILAEYGTTGDTAKGRVIGAHYGNRVLTPRVRYQLKLINYDQLRIMW